MCTCVPAEHGERATGRGIRRDGTRWCCMPLLFSWNCSIAHQMHTPCGRARSGGQSQAKIMHGDPFHVPTKSCFHICIRPCPPYGHTRYIPRAYIYFCLICSIDVSCVDDLLLRRLLSFMLLINVHYCIPSCMR